MSLVAACCVARFIADFGLKSNERLTFPPLVVTRGVGKEWRMVFRGPAEDPGLGISRKTLLQNSGLALMIDLMAVPGWGGLV
jgi:hypothetical protein